MRYATVADIQRAIPDQTLIWLSCDDPSATVMDVAVVEAAIKEAEELVDSHIRERYPVPFDATPTLVKSWTVAIARHSLYCRRPDGQELPDGVVRGYSDALRMLDLVRARKLSLGIQAGEQAGQPQPANAEPRFRIPKRKFGDDVLDKF